MVICVQGHWAAPKSIGWLTLIGPAQKLALRVGLEATRSVGAALPLSAPDCGSQSLAERAKRDSEGANELPERKLPATSAL
jgi:hypothetical protein